MIKSTVENDTVTCRLFKVDLESALRTILASVKQTITFRIEAGTIYIMPKIDLDR